VYRWRQSALCATALDSESLYSWFDPVEMVRMLTGIHGETAFPGVEEPYSLW